MNDKRAYRADLLCSEEIGLFCSRKLGMMCRLLFWKHDIIRIGLPRIIKKGLGCNLNMLDIRT